jgi:glycerol kinase
MPSADEAILAIDQGTTNTKAVLVGAEGTVLAQGAAAVGVSSPKPGYVEQDAYRIWASVGEAVAACLRMAPSIAIAAIALSTQRESVVGWRGDTGMPVGPVIGWQDRRTAKWCNSVFGESDGDLVQGLTGLRIDPMFSAPKMRWLVDHVPAEVSLADLRLGTVDSWLIWQLTGGAELLCEAGNASRTLLFDIATLRWDTDLLQLFGVPPTTLPTAVASDYGFGVTHGFPPVPDGTPIVAVLADSHAALFGHGCTEVGMAKATYGTGSSVMAPVSERTTDAASVPTTLAWVTDGSPAYAMEGNILSSGAALSWAADLLTGGSVAELVSLAATVPDSGGVTMVPAFAGLGAPHWDRSAQALISGLREASDRRHVARAAVDAVSHQICDILEVIEARSQPLSLLRADGGATVSELVMQTQADLLGRDVQVAKVAEVSALGAARLAWQSLGAGHLWRTTGDPHVYSPALDPAERGRRRRRWAEAVRQARIAQNTDLDDRHQEEEIRGGPQYHNR